MSVPLPSPPSVANEVRQGLQDLDAASFTSSYILDRLPAIFPDPHAYVAWRIVVGKGLGVDPLNLAIVGSTGVGVSLSPKKFLRPFHRDSDVDLAVVSTQHFDEAWRVLRDWGPGERLRARTPHEKRLLRWHRSNLVFDGTIATEQLLPYLPFGVAWAAVLGRAGKMAPTLDRTVNARIYRDYESLRNYHHRNAEKLKASL